MTNEEFAKYQPLALAAMGKIRKKYYKHVPFEDCRQTAYLALLKAFPTYNPDLGAMSTLVYTVVYRELQKLGDNYCNIHVPSSCWRDKERKKEGKFAHRKPKHIHANSLAVPDNSEQAIARLDAEIALSGLPPREYQTIVALYGLNGKEIRSEMEYAELQGVSRQAVAQVRLRALERMRVQARFAERQVLHRGIA